MNNTVKITSGKYKGQRILTPGGGTHPMGERERLALFNMILGEIPSARVLDAYAGSGALGIEALSRGAKGVVFIDKSGAAMRTIAQNCSKLGIGKDQATFCYGSVGSFIEKFVRGADACGVDAQGVDVRGVNTQAADVCGANTQGADVRGVNVILADPPYDDFYPEEVELMGSRCLMDGGILVLSHPGEAPDLAGLSLVKSRKYAGATISVYKKG